MPASLAVPRTFRSVALAGAALSEHLVQRGENGVNCGARGAVSPFKFRCNIKKTGLYGVWELGSTVILPPLVFVRRGCSVT